MDHTDFWWLDTTHNATYDYVQLGHHRPMRDDEQPCSITWDTAASPVSALDQWCKKFHNTNVYRSLTIWSSPLRHNQLLGPYLVDIDNEQQDLQDAQLAATRAVAHLQESYGITEDDLRIFFTGRKGFNLEVRPSSLQIQGTLSDQLRQSAEHLARIIEALRTGNIWPLVNQVTPGGTLIDTIYGSRYSGYQLKHPHVRLHGSYNKWLTPLGQTARRKLPLTIEELNELTAHEIMQRSVT